jgi:hypothetical protein
VARVEVRAEGSAVPLCPSSEHSTGAVQSKGPKHLVVPWDPHLTPIAFARGLSLNELRLVKADDRSVFS